MVQRVALIRIRHRFVFRVVADTSRRDTVHTRIPQGHRTQTWRPTVHPPRITEAPAPRRGHAQNNDADHRCSLGPNARIVMHSPLGVAGSCKENRSSCAGRRWVMLHVALRGCGLWSARLARRDSAPPPSRSPSRARRGPVSACGCLRQWPAPGPSRRGSVCGRSEHPRVSTISRRAEVGCSAVSSTARFESVETDTLVWSLGVRSRDRSRRRAVHARDRD